MPQPYYTPSGVTPMPGFLLAMLSGIVLAIVPAALYAYFGATAGNAAITAFALGAFGLMTGWLAMFLLRRAQVRSPTMAIVGALVIALVALYANWIVWTHTRLALRGEDLSWGTLILEPGRLVDEIATINQRGVWKLDREVVHGGWLWMAWAAEAIVVLLVAGVFGYLVNRFPFCEKCRRWCTFEPKFIETTWIDRGQLKERMEAGDFALLESIGPRERNDINWYRFDLYCCASCGATATLSAEERRMGAIGYNWYEENARPIPLFHNLLLSSDDITYLRAIASDFKRYR